MKFLRVGNLNKEKPAIIDKNGIIRDVSAKIAELNPHTLNDSSLQLLRNSKIDEFPEIPKNVRIGACVSNPENLLVLV